MWNLNYFLGKTTRVFRDAESPMSREKALEGAQTIAANGWRVWVEHARTGERIFESDAELKAVER